MSYSVFQGVVAGGAAVYLQNRLQTEAEEQDADSWPTVALQVNHLLLLTAETLCFGGVGLGAFKPFVQAVYVLTPVTFLAQLLGNGKIALSPQRAELCNKVYRAGVGALSLVTLALGDPLFVAGSLSLLAVDLATSGIAHQVYVHATKICALSALIGYGMQAVFSQGALAVAARVSTAILAIKLCIVDSIHFLLKLSDKEASEGNSSSYYDSGCRHHRSHYYVPYHDTSSGISFCEPSFHSGANAFCRASVWN